ncbi:hypothetical protein F2Q68_00036722 [Brassica cretica]|uniref:Uncharacterized protein n=1 Tax=Brassica cretica TaxID=69181 RepID=A0A8S9H6D5_BRACR|nr:hypothetical protein F2Q68_00036722 [Brassica cretica]
MGSQAFVGLAASRKCFLPHEQPEGLWLFRLSARTGSREALTTPRGGYLSDGTSEKGLENTQVFIIIILATTIIQISDQVFM